MASGDFASRTTHSNRQHMNESAPEGIAAEAVASAAVELERDVFLRTLIRELSGTLQDVVGLEEAAGFVSVVGQAMGRQIDGMYREALGVERLDAEQVGAVLVDLKRRIRGEFYIIEQDGDRIVLGNRACPFAEKVIGRPAMCMMTSNVFGSIAADNLGYARVVLEETIAEGAPGCRVVVQLKPDAGDGSRGREYFGAPG
jgi:predicted ArsR family transcriptional regulator